MRLVKLFPTALLLVAVGATTLASTPARAIVEDGSVPAQPSGTLFYGGGTVFTHPKLVMVYTGAWDQSPQSLNAQAVIERFYTSIAGTKYFNTLSGYHDAAGNLVDTMTPIPIVERIYNPDTSNPATNDSNDRATAQSRARHDDGSTIYITVPSAGISTPCGGGAPGCRGIFAGNGPYVQTNTPIGGAWVTAFSGNTFSAGWSELWLHELVETMLDGGGNGWNVVETWPTATTWDIADVCDYSDSPWWVDNIRVRTTSQNDDFHVNGFAPVQLNTDAMHKCVHSYMQSAEMFAVGNYPYHLLREKISASNGISPTPSWDDLGSIGANGPLAGGPGAAAWRAGHVDVFNLDWSQTIQHGWWVDGTAYYGGIGTPPAGWTFRAEPAVVSSGPGNMSVLVVGTRDGGATSALWQRTFEQGGDTGWMYRGVPPIDVGGVGATAFADGTVDAFVTGSDGAIYRAHIDDTTSGGAATWSTWHSPMSGRSFSTGTRPSVTSWEPGYFQMALNDVQGQTLVCSGTTTGHCSDYGEPAVGITASPAIANLGDGRLLLATRGADGQEYLRLWDHDAFGAWTPVPGGVAGASPALVAY